MPKVVETPKTHAHQQPPVESPNASAMSSVIDPNQKDPNQKMSSGMLDDYFSSAGLLKGGKHDTLAGNIRELLGQLVDTRQKLESAQADSVKHLEALRQSEEHLKATFNAKPQRRSSASSSSRSQFVMTGAIMLPDGTRLCLRHIYSYRPGGSDVILFFGPDNKQIGQWNPPQELEGPQKEKERQTARMQAMASLDDIFSVGEE